MSNSIRITCDVCKKKRVPGLGVTEIICGRFFDVIMNPHIGMCSQCRHKIAMAAMSKGIEKYVQLYTRRAR